MFMNITQEQIAELHRVYGEMTGLAVPLTQGNIFRWEAWCFHGFNLADLRLVVGFLKGKIKTGPKTIACLRFSNFIGNPEFFAEDLAEARAVGRRPVVDKGRREVLRVTGRETERKPEFRTAAQILAGEEAFKQFQALKAQL